jgi:hypothetical protein
MSVAGTAQELWTDAEFEHMSWHDNHVHGLRVVEGEHGTGLLILDLDYITEWACDAEHYRFRIVPATLTFEKVTNLRIALDYATPKAGLVPFSIDAIERTAEPRERYTAQVWRIAVNWPAGEISFEASGFEQRARGAPVLVDRQYLTAAERGDHASTR